MSGRFYKLHFLLAAFIAFLSPQHVLPRLSGVETTGQLYATPTFAPQPASATVTASSRAHQAWFLESTRHNAHHTIVGICSVPPAIQIWRNGPEFGVTCRPSPFKSRSNCDRAPPALVA